MLGREGRTDISFAFLEAASHVVAPCGHRSHLSDIREPTLQTAGFLVQNWPMGKKLFVCFSRSYVNEVTVEYILCGCLYFVNFMANMACLIFQNTCTRCK